MLQELVAKATLLTIRFLNFITGKKEFKNSICPYVCTQIQTDTHACVPVLMHACTHTHTHTHTHTKHTEYNSLTLLAQNFSKLLVLRLTNLAVCKNSSRHLATSPAVPVTTKAKISQHSIDKFSPGPMNMYNKF